METFPTLYKRTSTGKIQTWNIRAFESARVVEGEVLPVIVTTYGQLGGKLQEAVEVIREGKNVGKANETTPLEQAIAEAKSQWEKKSKASYVQSLEDAEAGKVDTNFITGGISPMLAHKYEEQGHKIKYPAFAQPKLDGHRCIAIIQDGKATLWSRTRKPINSAPHIVRELEFMFGARTTYDQAMNTKPETIILDGELYNHDYKENFEDLTSLIRQSKPAPGHEAIQFWVYDLVSDAPFYERRQLLDNYLMGHNKKAVIRLETFTVENEEEMTTVFGVFLAEGYEGLMLRNFEGGYKNKRSYDLQKVKVFQDSEFKVLAIEQGKGKMAGLAMFVCDAGNGQTFRVKMKGALESLRHYYDNPEPWIGKDLTVKYQGLSADGIPRFPVAERFRQDV